MRPRCVLYSGCPMPQGCEGLARCLHWQEDVVDGYDDDPAEGWGLADLGPVYVSRDRLAGSGTDLSEVLSEPSRKQS